MAWYKRMNQVIEYIESRLGDQISIDVAAEIAGQTAASFQQTFSIVTDMSIYEYIRRRRMTMAAFDMQNSQDKVITISMKYGYESPEAFTRAFKEIHGISPLKARKDGTSLVTFPRITFLLTVKGDVAMNYKVEKKEAFTVYGIEKVFSFDENKDETVPQFWTDCINNGSLKKLAESTGYSKSAVNAVCSYRNTGKDSFPYMLFVNKTEASNSDGFTEIEIPAATWAIFRSEKHSQEQTSGVIQSLNKRVYTDWIPTAPYKKIDGYELEMYYNADDGTCYCETWVRVEADH